MLAIALALLVQDPAAAEVGKLLSGLDALFVDPLKNADELDRRRAALAKALEGTVDARIRDAALSWLPKLARKTGRPAEALAAAKERLKSKSLDPRYLETAYVDAIRCAALALKPDEAVSLARALAKDQPASPLASSLGDLEREAPSLGKSGTPVTAPAYDGSKSFAWSTQTKDKFVLLYFTASW